MKTKDYSLREKKHARTKVGLMNAFMDRMKKSRFDDISIKEVCRGAEIAEGTFFNYFPEKIDVIGYYLQLLTLKMVWKAKKEVPVGQYLPLINSIFTQLGEELAHANVIYQILSVLLLQSEKPKRVEISDFEKRLAFPDQDGIEHGVSKMLDSWFKECLEAARKNGELPVKTNIDDVQVALMTILSGTLIAIKFGNVKKLGYHYKCQLQALWDGLGVKE